MSFEDALGAERGCSNPCGYSDAMELQGVLVLSVLGSNPTWFPLLGPVTLDSDVVLELSDWPWVPALPKITNFRFSLGCKCCSPMISPDSPPHQTKLLESPRIQESSCLVEEYRQNLF